MERLIWTKDILTMMHSASYVALFIFIILEVLNIVLFIKNLFFKKNQSLLLTPTFFFFIIFLYFSIKEDHLTVFVGLGMFLIFSLLQLCLSISNIFLLEKNTLNVEQILKNE